MQELTSLDRWMPPYLSPQKTMPVQAGSIHIDAISRNALSLQFVHTLIYNHFSCSLLGCAAVHVAEKKKQKYLIRTLLQPPNWSKNCIRLSPGGV